MTEAVLVHFPDCTANGHEEPETLFFLEGGF
jgi:hypothetical protein